MSFHPKLIQWENGVDMPYRNFGMFQNPPILDQVIMVLRPRIAYRKLYSRAVRETSKLDYQIISQTSSKNLWFAEQNLKIVYLNTDNRNRKFRLILSRPYAPTYFAHPFALTSLSVRDLIIRMQTNKYCVGQGCKHFRIQ